MMSPLGPLAFFKIAEHFQIHGLRLGALKYGVGNAMHAGMDLIDRYGFKLFFAALLRVGRKKDTKPPTGELHVSLRISPEDLRVRYGFACRAGFARKGSGLSRAKHPNREAQRLY